MDDSMTYEARLKKRATQKTYWLEVLRYDNRLGQTPICPDCGLKLLKWLPRLLKETNEETHNVDEASGKYSDLYESLKSVICTIEEEIDKSHEHIELLKDLKECTTGDINEAINKIKDEIEHLSIEDKRSDTHQDKLWKSVIENIREEVSYEN